MEEKQQIILANQDGGTMAGAAPTFFVILKQPGNGKTDQGILVTNRDACALASSVSSPGKSKGKICLPADCTVGGITVTLDNNSMWNEFYHRSTEMILTKQGRRMFPYCRYWITGLDSNMKYILVMDISPVDNHRYKWNGRWWEPSGKAEPHVLGRVFIHPESPSTGHYWMHQPVSFYKLKLTNNTLDQEGHIILHSMHRYLPRLHLVPAEKATEVIQLNGPGVHTFTFPQTEFFAVTAYQNIQITQLKIDYNPFAKGFRDDGLNSKPQRDGKQKNSSDQEGNSVPSSPGQRVRLTEGEGSEIQLTDSDPLSRGHETSGKCLEKPSLSIKRDFLGFMDIDSALGEVPQLKQEVSESLVANNFEDGSHVVSPLDPNGNFNVVIKEEPVDDYEYELAECPEGVTIKQEETDEETDVYSNSDDDPILEKQLKRHNKVDNLEADHPSSKWLPNSPSGVAQAKMFKLDAGKMPVVYLEPCAVTKSTVKISELPDNMLSTSRKDKSSVLTELDYLPTYIENSSETGFCLGKESENGLRKHSPDLRVVQKYPLLKEPQWKYPELSDSINTERIPDSSKSSAGDPFLGKEDLGRRRTTVLKISTASKVVNANQNAPSNVPGKRGRPRKLKLSKAGRPPKNTGKSLTSTKNTPVGPGSTFPDVKPDLEDVDGVLFVSFESKEALDIHAVDGTTEEPCSLQASATNDPGCRARISQLEKELIEDLKALRHKQVIHPGLQEVGLKLNSVDPTMSIDLKYLGVQLPLAPATSFPFWNLTGTNPASPDAGFPFVSRTGKTNDFTKIKGWRGKFHSASASRSEGGNSEGPLKNRSAFCSDKLDEYLENEGKLMETSMGFSSNAPTSPVVYQLPTKSTSYVRTLDSVLKKQSTVSPSTSYSLKPHSVPPASRKAKSQNKQATFGGRTKSSYKSILPYPVSPKQKHAHMIPGDKVAKNSSSTISENQVNNFVVPTLDENTFPKQISLRQAHQQQQQQQQGTRPPGLSKSQVKLMDLEDCALWEGKPRTYITEERADVSLTTLLTAQASLKTKPIHTIIRKRAPPCNNDFCRLGCVCSSLALEKRQPAHCRRPDCMFGCTCLKRKVVLVKGGSKAKHFQRKAAHRDPVFYDALGEEQREEEEGVREEEEQLKEKKRRKKLEYTICETEPEQPVRHYPLWVKVEGEVDPEPVYIPTPSVIEPMKPLLLPQPEVLPTTVKGKVLTGIKPARAYTPKPNPVIREEDKDPVYLYFESMMTCARVRVYERKKEEQRQPSPSPSPSFQQQGSCQSSPENCSVKEPDSEQQPLKPITCDLEDDSDKSQEKSWKSSCNEGESSTSYVHQRSPGGPTKLIEIISDCNWEEDRNKILSILSQHINSNMPQSLKVGSFIIELASQRKSRGEKNPPVYSSRVKISMPSCQDQDDMAEKSGSETPDGPLSPGKMDDISPVQTDALDSVRERLHGGKGLPFYAGLSPAGKLVAYKRKPSSSTSGLIQVASNAKVAASRKPRTLLPSTSNCKTASSSGATTNRPGKNLKAFVPAKRPIVVVTTAASSSMVTTPTSSLGSVPIILSGIDGSPPVSQRPENAPQIPVATPQVSPNTVKRTGPRLLLIPVQQGSPTLRPVPNTQLQGHRMVLQPVRSPSGMNLFRHPNGQIVQLLPLHQLRGSNTQPSLQPVMFRNPGSVMGIRLPTPSKPSETPPSSASSSAFSVMNPVIQAVGSSPPVNVITQAPSLLSSGPSFVSQSGTLTLRISPPEPQSFASKTGSETKITYSSGGQPVGTASLIPLQSGSFALLQLPGQKPVPSSILQHVASLQMKRESQSADQKDETSFLKREQDTKKALQSEGETIDSEANVIKQNSGATASEEILHDSVGDGGDHLDEESLTEEGPITVKPSQHSYITGSRIDEDYKDVDEEYGIRNHNSSKEKVTVLEVKTISKKASNVTVQSISNIQLKKLGDVKVEQQKGLENPEEKSSEFPIISKEGKIELSGSKVVEQQSLPQPEAKEKGCGDSLEKDSIRERWRKHLKGPLTQKCVGTSQECKKEADEQLIKEIKTCQENSDVFQQEQGISDLLGKSGATENVRVLKTECDSWSKISSPTAFSIVPRRATKGSRGEGHFQGHLLLSGEQIQPKQEKKGGRSSADLTVLDLEEEDEEDENEKTDDSIDEIVDVVSDYQSEEVDDVEKVNNCVEYIEDDEEQVDIETVEELSEEINVAHMKTTAAQTQTFKQPCRTHISADEKAAERSRKAPPVPLKLKPDYWSEKLQKEAEAFAYYRRTHTANERRRRGEMRDLFEKLKITLGLLHSSKVSKSLILTRAFSEIQGLTDQADKLIGQKNLLTRKRNVLIRKVSSLSGKTEEVVLKKLEYIYAKQQALEAQKRKKKMGSDEFDVSPRTSKQQEGSSASSVDLGQMFINNRKGKPLILSRKRDQATENTSPSNTPHTAANIVMTPQGQLLTLKGPLFSGPVVTVSPALLEADLKPQVATSAVAQSENDDLFMMPRIVNVTSLATEGGLVDMGGSKYPHEVPDGKPSDHLKSTIRNEDNSFEDSGRISSRSNHRDGRMALGPTPVFLANKDSGFPQIVDVSSMQEAQEFLPKKISGEMRGIQYKWKECESRREKLKPKESTFHKLKMKELKDSSIEMELRKVASAIEEAALDPSELLTNMEDEDDTDETLTSLLNEIAFLNQQLNDDSVSLAELPSSMDTEFTGDARRAFISKLPPGNRTTFQVGHLGTGLKELPDVQGESDSVSPLLLHLEDDDFSENEKQLAEPASEPDVLKIVIDSEIKDSLLSHRKASDGGKSTSGVPAEPESVSSPPVLHMKAGLENSSTDTLWRPMPKLAPLGLKVANPSSDADGQSLKVMPSLAPVAAKVGSVGHKVNLTGNDQECRESKVMPTLAPVVAKLGNSGASPSSAGK
ncbi:MAX gene-associated protein isoform X7 [Mirounga leonina]|uniref:MAX gene-associated protein isoform X7 n=1 Tax=Mirounga leonina TaxID=9715 RepID=UPI00156BEE26|nr:MAX gene-associated protein isoform X7 [Mirounga leonina]